MGGKRELPRSVEPGSQKENKSDGLTDRTLDQ